MEVKQTPVIPFPKKVEPVQEYPIQGQKHKEQHIQEPEKITKELLKNKVDGMNDFLEPTTTSVKFKLHEKLDIYYVQVIDTHTDTVLKEIPNKKFLDMYASMAELAGLMVDDKF